MNIKLLALLFIPLTAVADGSHLIHVLGRGVLESNSSMRCGPPPYTKYRLFRIPITNIQQGDIISINADFQVTGEENVLGDETIMVSSEIMLGYTPEDIVSIRVVENTGQNFSTTQEHHFRTVRHGVWIADTDYPVLHLTLASWCALGADKVGRITVDVGMGQMLGYWYR